MLKEEPRKNVVTGKIVIWHESKGFGWVECDGKRLFFHSREFAGVRGKLAVGEELRFVAGIDIKGRPCARLPDGEAAGRVAGNDWLLLGALLVLPLLGLARAPVIWWWPLAQALALSAATFRLYDYDKRQALKGGWRVPETSLHLAEIAGGWPGAFLAQKRFRHKCSKGAYLAIFWCIVVLHQVVGLDFSLNNHLSKEVWQMMGEGSVFGN
ncbi:MAG: hypothetical protein RLZZ505_1747 [Verrucomicrobiota bacterium]|jgi:uncharacterized membrane protein YsdA (DUF1294 family)/cold shock CspA family protein